MLGLNPGGDFYGRPDKTIERHTNEMLRKESSKWSEYCCESWAPNEEPGKGRFQRNIVHLIQRLGYDPRDVPASNAVFVRSRDEDALKKCCKDNGMSLRDLFEICWPLHQEVIGHIKPKLILCMGREAEWLLQKKLKADTRIDSLVSNYREDYLREVFENKRGCRLVSVRHPSRGGMWTKGESGPSSVIMQALAGAKVRWSSIDVR